MSVELQYEEKALAQFTVHPWGFCEACTPFAIAVISVFLFLFIIYPMLKIVIYPSSRKPGEDFL